MDGLGTQLKHLYRDVVAPIRFVGIKRHNYRFNFVFSDLNGTETDVSEIRKGRKDTIIHISFAVGQEKVVETLNFLYAIN